MELTLRIAPLGLQPGVLDITKMLFMADLPFPLSSCGMHIFKISVEGQILGVKRYL